MLPIRSSPGPNRPARWAAIGLALLCLFALWHRWSRGNPSMLPKEKSEQTGKLPLPKPVEVLPSRRSPEGTTVLRVVDEGGNAVPGVPIFEGEPMELFAVIVESGAVMPHVVGTSDADGIYVPERFPLTLSVGQWPAMPPKLALTDDGREHVMTVTPACDTELTWDLPGGQNPTHFIIPGDEALEVSRSRATLHVPCGELRVGTQMTTSFPSSPVELVDNSFDSRRPTTHLRWKNREAITICLQDEDGRKIPETYARAAFDAWPLGDCWGVPPIPAFCPELGAPGFLETTLCPEESTGWERARYDVILERAAKVHYSCEHGGKVTACTGQEVFVASCVTSATPDAGQCDDHTQTCDCPEAPDAHLIVVSGTLAGERAEIVGNEAVFSATGTAAISVPDPAFCPARLERREEEVGVSLGRGSCTSAGAEWSALVAGNYRIRLISDSAMTRWSNIRLADNERKILPLSIPGGHPVEVSWTGDPPTLFVATWRLGDVVQHVDAPAGLHVPAGAELWVQGAEGACYYKDPSAAVVCDPDGSEVPAPPEW